MSLPKRVVLRHTISLLIAVLQTAHGGCCVDSLTTTTTKLTYLPTATTFEAKLLARNFICHVNITTFLVRLIGRTIEYISQQLNPMRFISKYCFVLVQSVISEFKSLNHRILEL